MVPVIIYPLPYGVAGALGDQALRFGNEHFDAHLQ
jgi:hypothetical protein